MKDIITEYGKSVLVFSIAGIIVFIVLGIFMWSKDEIATDVYAREEGVSFDSDKDFKEIINSDVDISVTKDLQCNTVYKINEVVKGGDFINVIKVDNPSLVKLEDDNITFLEPGVINLYVEARLNTGEATRTWLAIGVDG